MTDDTVERLESYFLNDPKNGGESLLLLAVHHLRNPGLDTSSAEWTAHKIEAALQAFYGGEQPIEKALRMKRGDIRAAMTRRGYDPALRVPWPVSIVFRVETALRAGEKTTDDEVFETVAEAIRQKPPRGVRWTRDSVKRAYYQHKAPAAGHVAALRRRLGLSQI
jgi:hypothetical protein